MKTTNLKEAARKTAEYLYHIDAEVHPELYQAIATLRQLINEEYKPERFISSQLIYTILEPAIQRLTREQRAEVLKAASERINGSSVFWPNYANLEREHAVNDCRNAALGILKHLEVLTDSHKHQYTTDDFHMEYCVECGEGRS